VVRDGSVEPGLDGKHLEDNTLDRLPAMTCNVSARSRTIKAVAMRAPRTLAKGQILSGPLFNEPMRVETVAEAGPSSWTLGLVGTRSERFRKVSLGAAELDGLTVLDSGFRYDGDGALLRPLSYLWLDATCHKVRVDGRVVSQATAVAIGVTADGERQVLGVDAGASEEAAFWTAFLRSLVRRGLRGVRLVISDAHEGLKHAVDKVLGGASWHRCRVHFMRNLLALVPHGAPRGGRGGGPDHLRATGPRQRDGATGEGRRWPAAALRAGGSAVG